MHPTIDSQRDALTKLCRKHKVRRLDLFGSATGDEFCEQTSDLDFLVEYQPLNPGEHADAYFGLLEDLQQLFNRPVDLVMTTAIRNRFFREAIDAQRRVLYAA